MAESADWKPVADAAALIDRSASLVHRWLRRPETETGIRRMDLGTRLVVHMPSLRDYEAARKPGRPPAT